MGLGLFPQFGDILWTSADWMSFPALMWAVLPSWHHGVPVVAGPHGQDAEAHLGLMARHGVRVAWMPPVDLARLTGLAATRAHPLPRVLGSGPQPLAAGLRDQVAKVYGIFAHEIWGMMETGAGPAHIGHTLENPPA
uniref:Acyl-coenzyme A synthetases/AMP-(Fatty) acid ligases n=1 Tax=Magnetospirillum gryphiswaldense TaxID=55518 RepID=A4U206_9PROT|nr:Acyl-coenzyme A synthetases/AMP-(fatty) acid ligases [Magnetospirillum gryphiswaldense MSR-1]